MMAEQGDQEVYQGLIDWYNNSWWKLTESEHLMPMIKAYVTPGEAEFLTGLPLRSTKVEDLAELKGMSVEDITPKLKELTVRGFLFEDFRENAPRYRFADSFFTFLRTVYWPGNKNEDVVAHAQHINKYFRDGWFDQFKEAHWRGLRTIPIEKTVEDTRAVLPFEDIVKLIDDFDYYAVSACPCRHRTNLDEDSKDCSHPLEVCLHFDDLGRYTVNNGMGREITREETFQILKNSADAGLVHGISTHVEKADTICNCCNDACMWLESYHKLGHPRSLSPSNYKVEVKAGTCRACGLCTRRCPMDALSLKFSEESTNKLNKAAVLDADLCIGCGVCAHKCPSDSLSLVQNAEIVRPPQTPREFMGSFMADQLAAKK